MPSLDMFKSFEHRGDVLKKLSPNGAVNDKDPYYQCFRTTISLILSNSSICTVIGYWFSYGSSTTLPWAIITEWIPFLFKRQLTTIFLPFFYLFLVALSL